MKKIISALFALSAVCIVNAQTRILTKPEVDKLFPQRVQQQLDLRYPIRVVYNYTDKTGTYYLPLCEKVDEVKEQDTAHWKIRALNLKSENGELKKVWELNDYVLTAQMEESMWFFTKYSAVKDLDGDGEMDPVVVYGTSGMNEMGDGRVKILVYYKGKKVAIRHQNSEMDEGRSTEVDKEFYGLPAKVQAFVRMEVMKRLADNDVTLFPSDWEQHMRMKKTSL